MTQLVRVPRATDANYVEALTEACVARSVDVVIPTIDPELPALARSRGELSDAGIHALVSGPVTIDIGSNKQRTHEWLLSLGMPTVDQWALNDVPEDAYPVIVKPVKGSASVGVLVAQGPADLGRATDTSIAESMAGGDEFTVDVWVDVAGRARCAVPRRRIEVRGGEVSKGITEHHRDIEDVSRRLAEALPDAYGPLTLQMFRSDEGEISIIEINPRFGGASRSRTRRVPTSLAGRCRRCWPGASLVNTRRAPRSRRCTATRAAPRRPTGCRSSSGTTSW